MVATSFEDAWNDNSPSFQNGPAPNQMQDAQRGRHEQPVQPVQQCTVTALFVHVFFLLFYYD